MDGGGLLAASRRERRLYEELAAAYRALAAVVDDPAPLDPGRLAEGEARAAAAVEGLRGVAAALAPHRLGGEAVPPAVCALWRESAALAAETAGANAALGARVRARRAEVQERLEALRAGRRGLAAYRPADPARAALTVRRA